LILRPTPAIHREHHKLLFPINRELVLCKIRLGVLEEATGEGSMKT